MGSVIAMPTRRLLLAVLAVVLALPAAAQASPSQLSVMMDDDLLVYRDDATRDRTLTRMKQLGVDTVRVTVLWSVVAEKARSTPGLDRRFRRLGADDPRAYPRLNWDRYDRLARACVTLRIGCYFNVTGPGPAWGHEKPPSSQRINARTWKPKPREFKLFVTAVGKRFSGRFRDENDGRGLIPKVSFWSLWNEPNQGGWLTPQWSGGKPFSPGHYRKLYRAGYAGLVKTGHAGDVILMGETAPLGSNKRTSRAPMAPVTFMKSFFCVERGQGCSDFAGSGPLKGSAWAHHPYTKNVSPLARNPDPNAITMANLGTLTGLLDQVAAQTSRIAPGMNVALTEFGFETNPPDPFSGVPLDTQATWNQIGDLIAWLNPRVIANTQFLLRDVRPVRGKRRNTKPYWFTYQSGLEFANGAPKPARQAYVLPFLGFVTAIEPETQRPVYTLWGQLRFRPNGAQDTALIQHQPAGSQEWTTIAEAEVRGDRNYFVTALTSPGPGLLRVRWEGPAFPGAAESRPIRVG